jgi:hypothetical protein
LIAARRWYDRRRVDGMQEMIMLAAVAINLGWWAVRYARQSGARARLAVRRQAVSRVIDAREGLVRLDGTVVAVDPLLEAPLGGQPCVFFDFLIEDLSRRARPIARQFRGVSFAIDDGTGRAMVTFRDAGPSPPLIEGPRDVCCAIPRERARRNGVFGRADPRIAVLMERAGIPTPGVIFPHRLQVREGVIVPGDRISVVGRGRLEIDVAGERRGYREPGRSYLIGPDTERPLFIVKHRA